MGNIQANVYKAGPGDFRVRRFFNGRWRDVGGTFPTREAAVAYLATLK